MLKSILFGRQSRDKMLIGVKKITEAVRCTMGAAGRCVLIGDAVYGNDGLVHLPTKVSKDGFTVARHFLLDDAVENRGAMLIREAATKTVEQAGDATTATCVLAESIITAGVQLIEDRVNPQSLRKGIDFAVEYVVSELKKISTPVRGDIEKVRQIATVSANNDKFIGDLIADAFSKIGFDGVIDIEISNTTETSIKISEGLKFERGWVSPLFVNNPSKETCEFENPLVLLYEKKITHHKQVQKALEIAMQLGKPLLIICEDSEQEGLAFMAMNNYQKKCMVCVVKSPEIGDNRRDWMEDIALLTGGTYISDIRGIDIAQLNQGQLGKARKVIVSKTETIIIDGGGDKTSVEDFTNDLKMNLTQAKNEQETDVIEKRIARLTGGIAVIQVGGATETELRERLDRVDDSVRATKSAISEGFVSGGGSAFLKIQPMNYLGADGGIAKGVKLVFDALESPFLQICDNAGIHINESLEMVETIRNESKSVGYNVLANKVEDMVEAGIIDSTKALRCALINAASVAGMFLTSECSIVQIG